MSNLMTKPFDPWSLFYNPDTLLNDFENWTTTYASRSLGYESANKIEIILAGVKKADLKVRIENKCLHIEYLDRKGRKCREVKYVGNATGASATLEDGILTIELSRPETSKVEVEVK